MGATVVTECVAICAYLADAFPAAGLAPPPAGRGAQYRWLFFTAGPLEAAVTARAMNVEPSPEQQAMVGFGTYERVIDVLEQAAAEAVTRGSSIAGDRFSAADVYVGSLRARWPRVKIRAVSGRRPSHYQAAAARPVRRSHLGGDHARQPAQALVRVVRLRRCSTPFATIGLRHSQLGRATCGTIRLKLLKIGAQVRHSVRRIKVAMASACPDQTEFHLAFLYLKRAAF